MARFNVQASAILRPIPETCGYLAAPPVSFPTLAPDWNLDPGTEIRGRYVEQNLGEAQGVMLPVLQDTYVAGDSGRTGRAFNVISGTWIDDFNDPLHDVYGLLMPDSSPGVVWEVRSAGITPGIEAADVVIRRGIPPANDPAARAQSGYTCYFELAYNASDNTGCRLAFEWGQPIRMDVTADNGITWSPVAIARQLGNLERYLSARQGLVRLRIIPSAWQGRLSVEIGDEAQLVYTRPTPDLPGPGNLRLYGSNGSIRFNYFPLRGQPVTVSGAINIGFEHPGAAAGFLSLNGPAVPPDGQTASFQLADEGGGQFSWQAAAIAPDAGDGKGSLNAPLLSQATLILPAVWTDSVDLLPDPIGAIELPVICVEEAQLFDDASRTLTSAAVVSVDNSDGRYAQAYGARSLTICASNGGAFYPRFVGVAGVSMEGIDLGTYGAEGPGRIEIACRGNELKMQHAAAQRRIYDGWCLYSAVRFECELGNIHPQFLQSLPLYVPPGATLDAPYGVADPYCAYPVLGVGTALSPRFDFGPEVSPWEALGSLVRISATIDPTTLQSLPFTMGFDVQGQFRFEAFDPAGLLPVMSYSDIDASGEGLILEELRVFNSVAQMRTDIDFQGQDSLTGALLLSHITLPASVRQAIGYRYPWLERNSRYTAGLIQQMAQTAAQIASYPTQVIRFKAPFQPGVYAGQKILVSEKKSLGGAGEFLILEMRSRYGMRHRGGSDGRRDCWSQITARRLAEGASV